MAASVEQILDKAGVVVVSKEDWAELQAKLARLEEIAAELKSPLPQKGIGAAVGS